MVLIAYNKVMKWLKEKKLNFNFIYIFPDAISSLEFFCKQLLMNSDYILQIFLAWTSCEQNLL